MVFVFPVLIFGLCFFLFLVFICFVLFCFNFLPLFFLFYFVTEKKTKFEKQNKINMKNKTRQKLKKQKKAKGKAKKTKRSCQHIKNETAQVKGKLGGVNYKNVGGRPIQMKCPILFSAPAPTYNFVPP